jgi:hypothetical protein
MAKLRNTLAWLGLAALALAAWTAVAAAMTFTAAPGASVAILAPRASGIAAVASAGGRILDAGPFLVVARFDGPGFVPRLYAAGALLVLDADTSGGCRGGSRTRTAAAP